MDHEEKLNVALPDLVVAAFGMRLVACEKILSRQPGSLLDYKREPPLLVLTCCLKFLRSGHAYFHYRTHSDWHNVFLFCMTLAGFDALAGSE